jgi:hypothetical protein
MLKDKTGSREFAAEFDGSELDAARKNHAEFIKRYPFKEHLLFYDAADLLLNLLLLA